MVLLHGAGVTVQMGGDVGVSVKVVDGALPVPLGISDGTVDGTNEEDGDGVVLGTKVAASSISFPSSAACSTYR